MKARHVLRNCTIIALAAVVAASAVGCGATLPGISGTQSAGSASTGDPGVGTVVAPSKLMTTESAAGAAGAPGTVDAAPSGQADAVAPTVADRLVISNASISIEVKNLDSGVTAVRTLAARQGATISELSVSAGSDTPIATPQVDGSGQNASSITPGSANISLRVPAARLAAAESDAAAIGRVISQTASESDVTQQHIDLAARLKNLRAEESRLRTFLHKATRVSEMLAIEKQLSRVRGDIESMQAQLTYLENQAALATLSIALTEPGALVSPAAGGWGFAAAVRDGVRAAAEVTRGLITFVLAISPLLILVAIGIIAIVVSVRRRGRRRAMLASAGSTGVDSPTQNHADHDAGELS